MTLPPTCKTDFEDPDDLLNFKLTICPDEGFYTGGKFVFSFTVGHDYPHGPPKVRDTIDDLLVKEKDEFTNFNEGSFVFL